MVQTFYKKIVFIDGDQTTNDMILIYKKYFLEDEIETIFIRFVPKGSNPPSCLKSFSHYPNFKIQLLKNFTAGKEVVDKYITALIQKAVLDGYTDINVISGDYDFVDIFRLVSMTQELKEDISFSLFIPKVPKESRLAKCGNKIFNVRIIK